MHQRLRRRPVARRLARIVFSPRLSFTPALPPAELQRWYEAHAAFYALLHSDECCVTVKLAAGDLLIVDNELVLHGRAGFTALPNGSQSQGRWFQECYIIDKDVLKSTYWQLRTGCRLIVVTHTDRVRKSP
jgi:alpha-ketoglutarate-dependent taurine dioxygenase